MYLDMDQREILHQCEGMQEDELVVLEVWISSILFNNEWDLDGIVITVYISWSDQNTSQSG